MYACHRILQHILHIFRKTFFIRLYFLHHIFIFSFLPHSYTTFSFLYPSFYKKNVYHIFFLCNFVFLDHVFEIIFSFYITFQITYFGINQWNNPHHFFIENSFCTRTQEMDCKDMQCNFITSLAHSMSIIQCELLARDTADNFPLSFIKQCFVVF